MYKIIIYRGGDSERIILDRDNQFLLSVKTEKSKDNAVGSFIIELAPIVTNINKSWMNILNCNNVVNIFYRERLIMVGVITVIKVSSNINSPQIRYTVVGRDFGIFFTKYFSLITNKYFEEFSATDISFSTTFIRAVSEELNSSAGESNNESGIRILELIPILWRIYLGVFRIQRKAVFQRFDDNENIIEKFGIDGDHFFALPPKLMFEYPIYNNLYQDGGDLNLYNLIEKWAVPHFNEIWMDTFDGVSSIPAPYSDLPPELETPIKKNNLPNDTKPGIKLYIRPSLFNNYLFSKADFISIPSEKMTFIQFEKTSEEYYTIFIVISEGAYNIQGAISAGVHSIWYEGVAKYGLNILEVRVPNTYVGTDAEGDILNHNYTNQNSIWHKSSEVLLEMYKDNDQYLSGTLSVIDSNIKIGQKIQFQTPIGNGNTVVVHALVHAVTNSINYASNNPIPLTQITFIRGRYIR